jgi:signal transduction histidine kinase
MADTASPSDPPRPPGRRLVLPGGLSARLLLATALVVVLANAIIVPVLLANRQNEWLRSEVAAGQLASLAVQAAPQGKVTVELKQKILQRAGLVAVGIEDQGVMRSVLAPSRLPGGSYRINLRQPNPVSDLADLLQTLVGGGDRMLLVTGRADDGETVQILVPDRSLRSLLLANLGELVIGALFTSAMAGALVYLFLNFFLVRPMQRITRAMERFRADPEDPAARLAPSGRRDEIGRAEAELDRMQSDLRAALASRARLATLGEAVAKINHEMRNMLTSAKLASERLASSGDPVVTRVLPRLERALDRAVTLATNVLNFGKSEEPSPAARPVPLKAALEAAAEDAQLPSAGVKLCADVSERAQVLADPDQLHRILVNLMRNAREALDVEEGRDAAGAVKVGLHVGDGFTVITLADNGPGLPERARTNLFQPFVGSARKGGAGLGLAISRELAQAHGGDLELGETGPEGTVFLLRLPGEPEPLPPKRGGRSAAPAD